MIKLWRKKVNFDQPMKHKTKWSLLMIGKDNRKTHIYKMYIFKGHLFLSILNDSLQVNINLSEKTQMKLITLIIYKNSLQFNLITLSQQKLALLGRTNQLNIEFRVRLNLHIIIKDIRIDLISQVSIKMLKRQFNLDIILEGKVIWKTTLFLQIGSTISKKIILKGLTKVKGVNLE